MEYWVYLDGEKRGPYSLNELKILSIPPYTLVWREGLSQWTEAKDLEELAPIFINVAQPPKYEEDPSVEENTSSATPPPYIPTTPTSTFSQYNNIRHDIPKSPPTYLVWAILSTFCCCFPLGIVALVYSLGVKSRFDSGNYEGAQKYSERTALWVIIAFVLGLMFAPLRILLTFI